MGYAFYEAVDRPAGYGVLATCDKRGCEAEIDRGLGYLCGDEPDGHGRSTGCGFYFCDEHLGGVGERGGCEHRQRHAWGKTLSCMAETGERDAWGVSIDVQVCLYRTGHDGRHAWGGGHR